MSVWGRQPKRFEFWRAVSTMSHTTFLAGVFFMFLPVGLLTDISRLGSDPVPRLIAEMLFSGGIAVAYVWWPGGRAGSRCWFWRTFFCRWD